MSAPILPTGFDPTDPTSVPNEYLTRSSPNSVAPHRSGGAGPSRSIREGIVQEIQLATGVTVGVGRTGSGPAVLLLGGLGMPSIVWEISGLTTQLIESGFEVITHTARGIPPASAPPAPYAIDDLAEDAAALLDELGLTKDVIVVGYSLGAFTAQALLRKQPTYFRGAVFIAGLSPSPLVEIVDNMELELIETIGVLPASVSAFELLMTTLPTSALNDRAAVSGWHAVFADDSGRWAGIEGLKGQLTASRDWAARKCDHAELLHQIQIPVLSIAFEHDLFFPPLGEQEAAERIPDCDYIVIPEAAHGGLTTHSVEPVERIVEFCSGIKERHIAP